MIQIKNRPAHLQTFSTQQVETLRNALRAKIARGEVITNADVNDKIWKTQEVRDALISSQNRKCCFCENLRAVLREFDGEHFRPKLGITGEPNHPGYWWLAYEWSNIFYACKTCNQEYKGNQFPIRGIRAVSEGDSIIAEMGILINPQDENPEDYIGFDWQHSYGKFVRAYGIDDDNRGSCTIKIVGLNNGNLMQERAESIKLLQDASDAMKKYLDQPNAYKIQKQKEIIEELTSAKRRFAGFNRTFFRAVGLGEFVSND